MDIEQNNLAPYLFHQGTNFKTYEYLGCHLNLSPSGLFEYIFRTWAPSADEVFVVGSFLDWDVGLPMTRVSTNGIYELHYTCDQSLHHELYKLKIVSKNGTHFKGDPFAQMSKGLADGASIILDNTSFEWKDKNWFSYRKKTISSKKDVYLPTPLNIYEVHAGSFIRHEDNSYYTYRELADVLLPYVKTMGYTHIEFLPLTEFPYDRSWGYQVCCFFAPTSRYGTPDDFKYLINKAHMMGIGILLDWVPAHFPKDEWGLFEFDGGPLYEYQGKDRQESRSWGTRFFDLGRNEVQSFLISSAMYWVEEFHIDGLRVDAVSSMLYLDYDRLPGEWFPNPDGTNINYQAVAFFKKLNAHLLGNHPDVLMIAEESTSFGKITIPIDQGGLGFSLKWNMGWANDFFDYLKTDPYFRKYKHKALNFPIMYAFTENYILPVSHDEIVYGKKTLLDKCFGSQEDQFLQFKTSVLYQMTFPGKKMLFMGTEYGQYKEWDYATSLEWFMLDFEHHKRLREYVAALNRFYLTQPALYEIDFKETGFSWIDADNADENIISYRRHSIKGDTLICILSFSGIDHTVKIPVQNTHSYDILFESNGTGESKAPIQPHFEKGNRKKKNENGFLELIISKFSGIILHEHKM